MFDPPVRDTKCKVHDYVKPCLGQTWSDWLTVRIMLFRSTGDCRSETLPKTVDDSPERELIVVFSRSHDLPVNKPSIMKPSHYIVDASGVHGVLVVDDTEGRCCKCEDI